MKFTIKHEIDGRMRFNASSGAFTFEEADKLQYALESIDGVEKAKVYERTGDAVVIYNSGREFIIDELKGLDLSGVDVPKHILENSGRKLNSYYKEKIIGKTVFRFAIKSFLPLPARMFYTGVKMCKYFRRGIRCLMRGKLEVPVLDAVAIGMSAMRGDFNTAGSIMYLLDIGEYLEEWTHKKSVEDLARSMSFNTGKVWLRKDNREVRADPSSVVPGDVVVVRMSNIVPFDGTVVEGEAMINQASLTGESMPVRKSVDGYVYAGTVVEEGEISICVKEVSGSTRFEKIIKMIEDSEKLKSAVESRAEHLADKLVPYTFLGTIGAWLLTRNISKAMSVLMVDFSCALKLAMPVTVLSAMRESGGHGITVKGGKYLEAIASATTIVFDKTGTLTKARPVFREVIPLCKEDPDDLLRIAACLEEHFPHSMAKAVTRAAKEKGLEHEEMHSKVEYILAHGIVSSIGEKRVIIGSSHFVLEDEKCRVDSEYENRLKNIPNDCSHLYLAIDNMVAAVICISDPLRPEARETVQELKNVGFDKIVMMTGDSERTAAAIAREVGVDEYYSEVLPEDKARFVGSEREAGHVVMMVGDGINDSPALSAANVGVAISDGAAIAREIADVTVASDDLRELVKLKKLSEAMIKRIDRNYKLIMGVNGGLILLGVTGVIQPTTSALFHNMSTLAIGLESMRDLLPAEPQQ